ncbi:MAG: hypothetical protein PUF50_08230 [Erysipelotrichaceae bacterium]|nr:hypothetical protein [Erysipelotrichaceae bacterium]
MKAQELRIQLEEKDISSTLRVQEHIEGYLEDQKKTYYEMCAKELKGHLISEVNWRERHHLLSCEQLGVNVRVGDICYVDFGRAYLQEAGFQHFGLVLSMCHGKAFVIPMTSNPVTYAQGYHPEWNPCGKQHLLQIGLVKGLIKPSVLFLNDAKFINTARIIDVKAHISIGSELFGVIEKRVKECINIG